MIPMYVFLYIHKWIFFLMYGDTQTNDQASPVHLPIGRGVRVSNVAPWFSS